MMPRGQCFFSWCFFWWRAGLYEVSCCLIQVLMRKEIQLASDFLIWCELLSTFLHSFIPFFLHSFLPGPITFQGHRYINTNTYIQKTIGTAAFWTSERNYLRVIFRETLTTDQLIDSEISIINTQFSESLGGLFDLILTQLASHQESHPPSSFGLLRYQCTVLGDSLIKCNVKIIWKISMFMGTKHE